MAKLDKFDIILDPKIVAEVTEQQIQGALMAIKLMPSQVSELEKLSARGDKVSAEVLRRYHAGEGPEVPADLKSIFDKLIKIA